MALKRAWQELSRLRSEPREEFTVDLPKEDDPLRWEIEMFGPAGSPYEGGTFKIQVDIPPKYPFQPPTFMFLTEIYHCNLSVAVSPKMCSCECVLVVGKKWHPSIRIVDIMVAIHGSMAEPLCAIDANATDMDSATGARLLDSDLLQVWKADRQAFEETAREWTKLLAMDSALAEQAIRPEPLEATQDSQQQEERRIDATLDGRAVTFAEMCESLAGQGLSRDHLAELWQDLPATACASSSSSVAEQITLNEIGTLEQRVHADANSTEEDYSQVFLPCPMCGMWYATAVLGIHLEGHFAFEACSQLCAVDSVESSDADVSDDVLATQLQQEEIEKTLQQCHALAGDRLAAMRLEQEDGELAQTLTSTDEEKEWQVMRDAALARSLAASNSTATSGYAQTSASSSSTTAPSAATAHIPLAKKAQRPAMPMAPKRQAKKGPVTRPPPSSEHSCLRRGEEELLRLVKSKGGKPHEITDEHSYVAKHFKESLSAAGVVIHGVKRCSGGGASRFRSGSAQRLMFHGCKTLDNERAILAEGFKVSMCVSGGHNYGTWFAYNAAYSDSGFAFNDNKGIRHMFICLVSNAQVIMDNPTMRVVGQDCAYPVWIVTYTHAASARQHTFNVGAYGRWKAPAATVAAPLGWEACDGKWVPVKPSDSTKKQ